jgi:hypothetical protein
MLRRRLMPPSDMFPAEPWATEAAGFDPRMARQFAGQAETMFALSQRLSWRLRRRSRKAYTNGNRNKESF